MVRKAARVAINRQNAGALRVAVADGLLRFAGAVVDAADPPDATPYGEGLVTSGGSVAFIDGRKVGGDATKPSRERIPRKAIVAFAGFGFPGRFQEIGTSHHAAQPFLWPAFSRLQGSVGSYMRPSIRALLASRRGR